MSDGLKYLTDKELVEYKKNWEFEEHFYYALSGHTPFKLIPIPMPDGSILPDDEKQHIVLSAIEEKATIIYQVTLDAVQTVVFGLYGGPVGVIYSLPPGEKYHC